MKNKFWLSITLYSAVALLASCSSNPKTSNEIAEQNPNTNNCKTNGINYEAASDFAKTFITFASAKTLKSEAIAEMCSFPLRINQNGKSLYIKDKASFIKQANTIFNDDFKNQLQHKLQLDKDHHQDLIFCNYQGASAGAGTFWFIPNKKGNFKIYTINV